jgi:hypothetical protein
MVGPDPIAVAVVLLLAVYAGLRVMTAAIGHFDRFLHR